MRQNSPQDAVYLYGHMGKQKKCLHITRQATLKKSGDKTETCLGAYTLLKQEALF